MQLFHHTNIIIHVAAGTLALVLGFITAILYKRKRWHVQLGRWFLWMMGLVVATGLIGIFVFQRNSFLLVITLLSGYNCFSGIRAIRLNGAKAKPIDVILPLIVITTGGLYWYSLQSSALYWSALVVYSTLGALWLITCYDLLKNYLSFNFRQKASKYEHAYKMISALSGLSSAFAGTVFPQYHPYSQFLPSVIGFCWILIIFVRLNQETKSRQKQLIKPISAN
ncbi:DUF2306 domain-containing protein [Pedobacter nutrimenti]|uniref:Uncharacterized protein n=1 Tax=Pedobacter nutrimenti TaxID=1241337 RepID=A0A318UYR4_9SPHI|nr:hypothetical protein [Pedobacter nutrimenti]PYF76749.1 hypothetical protein B0O44_101221 [Pedobacter nutrimenti]